MTLSPYLLSCPYISWAIAYFYTHTLTPKKNLKHPFRCIFVLCEIILPVLFIFKTRQIALGTATLQCFFFLVCLFFFTEKLVRKISCFIIFELTLTIIEIISGNLFLVIRNLFSSSEVTALTINQITEPVDVFLMTLLTVVIGVIFFQKEAALLNRCLPTFRILLFLQLLLPVLTPVLAQGIIVYQTNMPYFELLVVLYWILCLLSFLFFLKGLKKIKHQEQHTVRQKQQLIIVKEQLAFSQQAKKEYAALRKWNHDAENHLLSLSYLMDMDKFDEAKNYSSKIFS